MSENYQAMLIFQKNFDHGKMTFNCQVTASHESPEPPYPNSLHMTNLLQVYFVLNSRALCLAKNRGMIAQA